jgi:non-heme chloroperoxidase
MYMTTTATPVVFVHGLWMHSDTWKPWMDMFRAAGYAPIAPGWPGDAATKADTTAHPERVAGVGVEDVVQHYARIISELPAKPILVGHSFGGLMVQRLLAMGRGSAAIAISPAQVRGVLPLPLAQLQSALPVLGNPANYKRAVSLTKAQFHAGFANAVSSDESDALHDKFHIPSPGKPLFEAALANLNPRTAAKVDFMAQRGPLLIIAAGKDRTVPEVVAHAAYKLYRKARTVNDYQVFPDRGHSYCIDHAWDEVANASLSWLKAKQLN